MVVAASAPVAAETYYGVTDLGLLSKNPGNGVAVLSGGIDLNDYIPDSGWDLISTLQEWPETGHIAGWGKLNGEGHLFGLTPLLAGDATGDGTVNGADLAVWQQNYNPLAGGNSGFFDGDWNTDGVINGADLALWQQNYNPLGNGAFPYKVTISNHAPEPLTLLGLAMGIAAVPLLRRRKRKAA